MLKPRRAAGGFTIVEALIALVVLGVLIALGAPTFGEFLQNQQIRAATEATLNGLQVARAEAVRRNLPVRFQVVSDLTSGCTLGGVASNWVVSMADPTNACDAVVETAPALIVQRRSAGENTPNAIVTAVYIAPPPALGTPVAANTVTFTPLGSILAKNADGSNPISKIDVTNASVAPTAARPLRIVVTPGGSVRMCDPAVLAGDPRACPAFP
jgi:type IV fimbrial biogenesis protein FimT